MTDDELTGIFDDLEPDDFNVKTTARIETHLPDAPHRGASAFKQFVEHNIEVVRSSSLAAGGGDINPVAILSSASTQWMFSPVEGETMGDYVQRLHQEAAALGATWVFISRQTMVGSAMIDDEDVPDAADPVAVEEALKRGTMSKGVVFFAQRHEGDEWEHSHGMMLLADGGLGPAIYGSQEQKMDFFAQILEGL